MTSSEIHSKPKHRTFRFAKMHGCQNDYIFMDARQNTDLVHAEEIPALAHRHQGIGGDGLVLITKPTSKQAKSAMKMWNSDASYSPMCGNALRCLALWEHRRMFQEASQEEAEAEFCEFYIESDVGLHKVRIPTDTQYSKECPPSVLQNIEIEMPPPRLSAKDIPISQYTASEHAPGRKAYIQPTPNRILLQAVFPIFQNLSRDLSYSVLFEAYLVSLGNPHCVIIPRFQDASKHIDPRGAIMDRIVMTLGPALSKHPIFTQGANVEFILPYMQNEGLKSQLHRYEKAFVRTYERGSGETLACGSGACAAHVVSSLLELHPRRRRQGIHMLGGELHIEWLGRLNARQISLKKIQSAKICMSGSAHLVYEGSFTLA